MIIRARLVCVRFASVILLGGLAPAGVFNGTHGYLRDGELKQRGTLTLQHPG
jgi:hypothetical protein